MRIFRKRRRVRKRPGLSLREWIRAIAIAGAVLVALEGLVRLFWSVPSRMEQAVVEGGVLLEAHPTRIWGMEEGVLKTGSVEILIGTDGLRHVEERGAKYRALTLGDSSIFGHGLEDPDTLHLRLRDALELRGVSADVLCGGVAGYSSEQTRVLLDEVGWGLKPDLLVLGQLWADNSYERFVDREWMEVLRGPDGLWSGPLRFGLKYSQLLQRMHLFIRPPPLTDPKDIPRVGWVKKPYKTGRRRVPLADYAANLDSILREAADRDIGVIVLQPANRERLVKPRGWAWDPYLDAMALVAQRRGVLVVDAAPSLEGLTVDEAFLDRMHPSGVSNGRYAEALDMALEAAGWPSNRLVPDAGPSPFAEALVDPFAGERALVNDPGVNQGKPADEIR